MKACREGEFDGGQTPLPKRPFSVSEMVYFRASGREESLSTLLLWLLCGIGSHKPTFWKFWLQA